MSIILQPFVRFFNKLQKENNSQIVDELPQEVLKTSIIQEEEIEFNNKLLKDLPDELAYYISPNIDGEVEIAWKTPKGYAKSNLKMNSNEFKTILSSNKIFYTLDYKNAVKKFIELDLELPKKCYDILLASKLENVLYIKIMTRELSLDSLSDRH
ncbi:MAG: hypothetical protein HC932_02655 [Thermales bacterium]|nr:hypothetical protein [Thermales bacterium]